MVTGADADAVDAVVGSWLASRKGIGVEGTPQPADADDEEGGEAATPRAVIAVDGKRVRGALDADGNAVHLLAAATHDDGLVLAQTDVHHKTNEIPRFAPLLDTLEITGMLITADCLHTQRAHARYLHERGPRAVGHRGPALDPRHRLPRGRLCCAHQVRPRVMAARCATSPSARYDYPGAPTSPKPPVGQPARWHDHSRSSD